MKKWLLASLLLILMSGCVSLAPYSFRSYRLGKVDSCNVGSSLVFVRDGWKVQNQTSSDSANEPFLGYESELLYTGISGNTVHMVYREYQTSRQGVVIRASYTLPLQYDISQSSKISFRSYLIEILSADPNYIKYRVLQDHGPINRLSFYPSPSMDSLDQELQILKEVPNYTPPSQRKLVRVTTVSGAEFQAYLAGESERQYFFSVSPNDTLYSKSPKANIRNIVPVK